MLDWYRALVQLRRSEAALRSDEFPSVESDPAGCWLRFWRGPLLVVANTGAGELTLPVAPESALQLGSPGVVVSGAQLRLPGWGVGILRTQPGAGALR